MLQLKKIEQDEGEEITDTIYTWYVLNHAWHVHVYIICMMYTIIAFQYYNI